MTESAPPLSFDEALAEWVRRNVKGANPTVGSVEFVFLASAWGGELNTGISVYFEEAYRPKRGKVAGEWRYGGETTRTIRWELPDDADLMTLLHDVIGIVFEEDRSLDLAKVMSAHKQVRKLRGRAAYCVFDCTLRPSGYPIRRFHWANLTGDYADINDYTSMCPSCHVRYDTARRSMNYGESTRACFYPDTSTTTTT